MTATASGWLRSSSRHFTFSSRSVEPETGLVRLGYRLDGIELEEQIRLPGQITGLSDRRLQALERALDLLHWVAGVSYWKAGCPSNIEFEHHQPDRWQAQWLTRLYRQGLAEFAYCNGLDPDLWPEFRGGAGASVQASMTGLARRTLVPMGGGKDSLVAWSRLQSAGDTCDTIQIGQSALIARVGEALEGHHWVIERRLDPGLVELNQRGGWNGHVPVTAINAAILVVVALILDYDRVAFANERSADEASLTDPRGREVNHQFSKSFEFELMFDEWVRRYIEPGLRVFSMLRRDRELAICREFARLEPFHAMFSSCNRNFHLDGPKTQRWCGHCPKCHFVYLALAPFMKPAAMVGIFGQDLLADPDQADGFRALMALDGNKPFECVGEADEARAALIALASQPEWGSHAVVQALVPDLVDVRTLDLELLCQPTGPHRIPKEFVDAA
jgi:UDP-N-acetyl-alpha-D-muramoyl-L-alanyl-L-glutamate epimerase